MTCKNCNYELTENAKFCSNCGFVNNAEEVVEENNTCKKKTLIEKIKSRSSSRKKTVIAGGISAFIVIAVIVFMFVASNFTRQVKNKEITIEIGKASLTGMYTGTMTKGVPDGEGEFSYESEERTYHYNGFWENGSVTGKGVLEDSKYMVNFLDVDRIGAYSGDVLNGKAHGQGVFTAVNDDEEKYTYTGSWENGLWNGQGVQKFENEDYYVRTGNSKDGEFAPSKLELIQTIGDWENMRFEPTEKAVQFIKDHDNFFPADDSIDINEYLDASVTYKQLIKNPENFGDKLINFSNYEILQIWEDNDVFGYTMTEFLATSASYDDYVYGYYLGALPELYEGSRVNICGLPISNSKFENVGGGTTLCYIIYGCRIN